MTTPPVLYRRLGRSGLKISVPIIGAMSFGSPEWMPWVIDKEKALPLLKAAWDLGINTIDTANVYSNGVSERIIAEFIEKNNIPRHEIVIMTKCNALVPDDPSIMGMFHPELKETAKYQNQYGLSRASIFNAVDASLTRLNTSYIDLLQIHRFDPEVPAEEIMKALHDLVQAGKVRYIGASSMRTWQFSHLNHVAERNGWTKFVSMQNEYSLIYREEERDMNPYCHFEGIGLIPWAPVGGGLLTRPVSAQASTNRGESMKKWGLNNLSPRDEEIINRVEEIAKKKGWTMAQVAIVWSASKVSSPIIGFNSIERLKEALVSDKQLTEEERKYLEEPYVPKPVRGHQ
ncbi:hypothetical protein M422DRAFT_778101 [Sphaerobolus stellatus SS14]|uniref:NADP-dependent oxidoreductase domain-containing protein n=1 Tax=Sphaerobolus stellatus (strain SS14) TaxID=990650 RepID=A0A0C9TEA4_SPHS4|nr:hypothetical protein M422DRAFT_784818 [Sphaerobolus stellatus SS14]KIJ47479.1 hypothetical protein M422DRAFT_778101 [Sphaerobolus stellatus SS14]